MHRRETHSDVTTVFVIDPDPATGAIVADLLSGSELRCEVYSTCRDFLAEHDVSRSGCVVLEQRIPDMSGLQLQRRLVLDGSRQLPLLFVLDDPTVSTAVELMRGGAIHVLEKPLRPVELLTAIHEALDIDRNRRRAVQTDEQLQDHIAALTRKEREVLELIAIGKSVKAMAAQLELSVRAIEQRRHGLMAKLHLDSPLELMRFSVNAHRVFPVAAANGESATSAQSCNCHERTAVGALGHSGSPNSAPPDAVHQARNGRLCPAANGNGEAFADAVSKLVRRPR
jgi:FixJ family two-component response regulator